MTNEQLDHQLLLGVHKDHRPMLCNRRISHLKAIVFIVFLCWCGSECGRGWGWDSGMKETLLDFTEIHMTDRKMGGQEKKTVVLCRSGVEMINQLREIKQKKWWASNCLFLLLINADLLFFIVFLFYIKLNWICFGFGCLVTQNKSFKYITLSIFHYFHTFHWPND